MSWCADRGAIRSSKARGAGRIARGGGSHEHGGEPPFNDNNEFAGYADAPGSLYPWPDAR